MLTDHHCHLQDEKIRPHLDNVLKKAEAKGITKFVSCGTSEEDWRQVLDLSKKYPQILPAVGIHPWKVKKISEGWKKKLSRLLENNPHCLVGEIGLDLHFVKESIATQQGVFKAQLEIARQYQRPVAVHNLKSWHLSIPVLKEFDDLTILLHSFSASLEITEQLLELPNSFFSFSGAILDHPKKNLPQIVNTIPDNRLLLETDSPYLLPKIDQIENHSYNEPANMIFVLEKIAEIKKLDIDSLKADIADNSKRFLHHLSNDSLDL